MALIECPECGKSISDKAVACPNCGMSLEALTNVVVRFYRPKKMMGFSINFMVYIDNMPLGVLGNGSEISCNLQPGLHNLQTEGSGTGSWRDTTQDFNIPEGKKNVDVMLKLKQSLGGFKMVVGDVS